MGSLAPRSQDTSQLRLQPSLRSLPTSASTVAPEDQAPRAPLPPQPRPARRKLWFFTALSVLAGVLSASAFGERTPPLRAEVRSGSPGFKQSSTGKNIHWQTGSVTIYLDDSLSRLGPGTSEAVMQAFGSWVASDPNLPSISFDTGKTSRQPKRDGKSTVSFDRITQPGHERDVAITITYSDDKTGEIIEADVILNATYGMGVLEPRNGHGKAKSDHGNTSEDGATPVADEAESEGCASRYDAQNVATHEAGHFFGLGEDMVERKATMFLSISQCETHKRELQSTDVSAVKTLYAAAASAEEKAAGPRACSITRVSAATASGAWAPALLLGLVLARRRRAR